MLKKIHNMEPTQQTAADYYKKHRKHSFLSRITIISSMGILLIVLALNISTLYSQEQTTTTHASTGENVEALLPSLPPGCHYSHGNNKITVACAQATPTLAVTIPITVALPQLPPQCSFVTSPGGSTIHCAAAHTPIPTVSVTLPTTCSIAQKPNTITCIGENQQKVSVQLPTIPDGCSYVLQGDAYYVVCEAK